VRHKHYDLATLGNVTQAFQPVFEPFHRLESLCHFPPPVCRVVFLIVMIGEDRGRCQKPQQMENSRGFKRREEGSAKKDHFGIIA
jgi:hypothetical protein